MYKFQDVHLAFFVAVLFGLGDVIAQFISPEKDGKMNYPVSGGISCIYTIIHCVPLIESWTSGHIWFVYPWSSCTSSLQLPRVPDCEKSEL